MKRRGLHIHSVRRGEEKYFYWAFELPPELAGGRRQRRIACPLTDEQSAMHKAGKRPEAHDEAWAARARILDQEKAQGDLPELARKRQSMTVEAAGVEIAAVLRKRVTDSEAAKRSADRLDTSIRNLNAKLTGTPLRAVAERPEFWLGYRTARKSEAGARTVNYDLAVLQRMLKRAGLWEELKKRLAILDERPYLPVTRVTPRKPITDERLTHLALTAQGNPEWAVVYAALTLAAANAGVRKGEVMKLNRGCFHMAVTDCNSECKQRANWRAHIAIPRDATKTAAGVREVGLNLVGAWAAARLLARATELGSTCPTHYILPRDMSKHTKSDDPLFARRHEGFNPELPQTSWASSWKSLRTAAGMLDVDFHSLRHTWNAKMKQLTSDKELIRELGGWQDVKMIDYYGRGGTDADAADRVLDKLADSNQSLLDALGMPSANDRTIN